MKKLSDIVGYLNLLDSLDASSKATEAVAGLKNINQVLTEHVDQYQGTTARFNDTFNKITYTITQLLNQVEEFKQSIRDEIKSLEKEYLRESLNTYNEYYRHKGVDTLLKERMAIDIEDELKLRTRLKNLTDWRLPGMIIRPGLETYIEDMVPLDPLYVVDHDSKLMRPSITKFTPEYQRRLREYVIDDWQEEVILNNLPDAQFGVIFAYNYFNYKPVPIIYKFLKEFYQKLRPGGTVIMTYNNCDLAHGVIRAESGSMLYTPARLIIKRALELKFELIDSHNGKADVSWLELRKPGDIASLRGGQTLAKILAKSS